MYSVAETEAILCLGLYSVVLVGRGLQAKVKGPTRNLTLNGLAVPRLEAPCRSTLGMFEPEDQRCCHAMISGKQMETVSRNS